MKHRSNLENDFIKLLTGHQSSLRGFIMSIMPNSPDIDDVLQDTNVVLWRKMKKFEPGSNFSAWAFATARNVAKGHWKKTKRNRLPSFNQTLIDAVEQTWFQQKLVQDGEKEVALEQCLARLKDSERNLIDARYHSGESLKSQASSIGRSPQSIRVSLFRIREKLRNCVKKRMALIGGELR